MNYENLGQPDVSTIATTDNSAIVNKDEKNLVVIFTLFAFLVGPFSPLIGYFVSSDKPWAKKQIVELLNFEISVTIALVVAMILNSTVILAIVGLPLMVVVALGEFVYLILGAVKASKGEFRKYPWTLRLIS